MSPLVYLVHFQSDSTGKTAGDLTNSNEHLSQAAAAPLPSSPHSAANMDKVESPKVQDQSAGGAIQPLGSADNILEAEAVAGDLDVLHNEKGSRTEGSSTGVTEVPAVTPTMDVDDPMDFGRHRRSNVSMKQMKVDHPKGNKRKLKKFYTQQNELIDQFLGSGDEERQAALDLEKNGPKVKIAIYGSASVNFFLFVIQMYAAISTGSLSLFATAADAFVRMAHLPDKGISDSKQMDLVSSIVMLVTSRMAKRPSIYKYPVVSGPSLLALPNLEFDELLTCPRVEHVSRLSASSCSVL